MSPSWPSGFQLHSKPKRSLSVPADRDNTLVNITAMVHNTLYQHDSTPYSQSYKPSSADIADVEWQVKYGIACFTKPGSGDRHLNFLMFFPLLTFWTGLTKIRKLWCCQKLTVEQKHSIRELTDNVQHPAYYATHGCLCLERGRRR